MNGQKKIAIIGSGAMGMLFGGYFSKAFDVTLVGRDPKKMDLIASEGLTITENDGTVNTYRPGAVADTRGMGPMDLVILFVKAGDSRAALTSNRHLIGETTVLLTLQNGAGHEALLKEFAKEEQVLIGTTQQGSYKTADHAICHSGGGSTAIGVITGNGDRFSWVRDAFETAGFPCELTDKVQGMIWNKLMINASSSVLSGVLQVAQGYVAENEHAWAIARKLIEEICAVATASGYPFDKDEQTDRLMKHLKNAPGGFTSFYADIKAGRKTEVDVINGAVVAQGHKLGVPVTTHEIIVNMVKAMEGRK